MFCLRRQRSAAQPRMLAGRMQAHDQQLSAGALLCALLHGKAQLTWDCGVRRLCVGATILLIP